MCFVARLSAGRRTTLSRSRERCLAHLLSSMEYGAVVHEARPSSLSLSGRSLALLPFPRFVFSKSQPGAAQASRPVPDLFALSSESGQMLRDSLCCRSERVLSLFLLPAVTLRPSLYPLLRSEKPKSSERNRLSRLYESVWWESRARGCSLRLSFLQRTTHGDFSKQCLCQQGSWLEPQKPKSP